MKAGWCCLTAAVAIALLLTGLTQAVPAATKLNARTSEIAIERKVKLKYPYLTRERSVVASCRRRTRREYFCLYGIRANFDDARADPEGPRYVYSGVGYARLKRGRVVASPLRPRRGDDYAP